MNKLLGLVTVCLFFLIGFTGMIHAQEDSGGIPRLDELVIYNSSLEQIERIQFPAEGPLDVMPDVIVPGNSFYVEIRGTNIGATVERGGFLTLSVAYPNGQMSKPVLQFYSATVPPNTRQRYKFTGDDPEGRLLLNPNLWDSESRQWIRPNFPLAEIWPIPWKANETNSMMLSVTVPEGSPGIQLRLRSRMSLFAYENYDRLTTREQNTGIADPKYWETAVRDEQVYPAWETIVTVGQVQVTETAVPIMPALAPQEEEAPVMTAIAPTSTMPSSFEPSNRLLLFGLIGILAIGVVAALYALIRFIQTMSCSPKVVVGITVIIALSALVFFIVLSLASVEQVGEFSDSPLWASVIVASIPALVAGIFGMINALIGKSKD